MVNDRIAWQTHLAQVWSKSYSRITITKITPTHDRTAH